LVSTGVINNQALAYYIALTQRFLIAAGIRREKMRFRQHEQKEMAHYATECWDAEIQTALGWIECVGIADRTAYDLGAHMKATGEDLTAFRRYDKERQQTKRRIVPDLAKLGPAFKDRAKNIARKLEEMEPSDDDITITVEGEEISIDPQFYDVVSEDIIVRGTNFIPHVIEPSYGIDRILYCILEHNLCKGEKQGEEYMTLQLPAAIAPVTVGVFPLVSKGDLPPIAQAIATELRRAGIMAYYDDRGSIGRRYARMDEIGTPFCITVDHTTPQDDTVTVRWRDTTEQERVQKEELNEWLQEKIR
jgi:glycyl-tRNA synthetase